jgi:hypothetical protein
MNTPYMNKIRQKQIIEKASNMTPTQLIKKIKSLKTYTFNYQVYNNTLISLVGKINAEEMLK